MWVELVVGSRPHSEVFSLGSPILLSPRKKQFDLVTLDVEPYCGYRKIPIISSGLIFVQKAFLLGLFSEELIVRGAYYWREICVSKCVGIYSKNSLKHKDDNLKQLKTSNPNSAWACIREGLLSEGHLRLRFGGLVFGRAYYRKDICVWDLGGLY